MTFVDKFIQENGSVLKLVGLLLAITALFLNIELSGPKVAIDAILSLRFIFLVVTGLSLLALLFKMYSFFIISPPIFGSSALKASLNGLVGFTISFLIISTIIHFTNYIYAIYGPLENLLKLPYAILILILGEFLIYGLRLVVPIGDPSHIALIKGSRVILVIVILILLYSIKPELYPLKSALKIVLIIYLFEIIILYIRRYYK